jgi:hypothetical protein
MATFKIEQSQDNRVLTLRPNAAGDNTDFTPVGEANNRQCVDEVVANEDTDYVKWQSELTGYDFYNLPNHTTETGVINYVKVFARGKSVDYAQDETGIYKIIETDDARVNVGYSQSFNLLTNSYSTFSKVWALNPRTSAAWTWADIDALQIGVQTSSPTITTDTNTIYRPSANGDVIELTPNGAATNWECVDEVIFNGNTDYVSWNTQPAPGDFTKKDLYHIPNHTTETGTIKKITVVTKSRCVYRVSIDGEYRQIPTIKIGGNIYYGDYGILPLMNNWVTQAHTWTQNPATSAAWTWANIDDLQIGCTLQGVDTGGEIQSCLCSQVYVIITYEITIVPELRTTQVYAEVHYTEDVECNIQKPEEISVDHNRNTVMINFWSGNRAVYDLSRNKKTMVLTGTFTGICACDNVQCVQSMGLNGNEVTVSGLTGADYNGTFRILSFGWKEKSEQPVTIDYILELEYAT